MAQIKTFTLKPDELELLKKRSRDGQDEFHTNLLKGYEEYGSLTEAQYNAFKSHVVLNPTELKYLESRSGPDGTDFFRSVKEDYDRDGYLSKNQYETIVKNIKEDRDKPVVAGKKVDNRLLRDGKAVCRGVNNERCKSLATAVVGRFGYCAECAPTAQEAIPA